MGRWRILPCRRLAALGAAALIGGCGSTTNEHTPVSAGRYVKSICKAVAPFENDVRQRSAKLSLNGLTTLAEEKQALQSFLTGIDADSARALTKLKAAGTPKVDNGRTISSSIVNALSQLKAALDHAARETKSLSTTDSTSFRAGAESVAIMVRSSLNGLGAGLGGLRSPELENAAAQEPACVSLGA